MKVHSVHAREISAPPERVGALLDGLGGEQDRLWPIDRWSTVPFELRGPLAAGTTAQHGPIRYAVEAYEPGRRLTFRFAPGLGLVGTHGFEVEPLGERRTRLTHELEGRVEPKMLALWPIVRGYHDALVEDILAQAARAATGHEVPSGRWPYWLRIVKGAELRLANRRSRRARPTGPGGRSGAILDRAGRVGGVAVPAALAALAALHAAWALGWRWPGGSDRELAERVLGGGATELPPDWATWAVAIALAGAAAIVRATASDEPPPVVRRLAWAGAAVFLIRGVVYVPADLIRGLDGLYERLDLAIYSPLCLVLGVGAAAVAWRAAPRRPAGVTRGLPA